jgi:hypothetical protein
MNVKEFIDRMREKLESGDEVVYDFDFASNIKTFSEYYGEPFLHDQLGPRIRRDAEAEEYPQCPRCGVYARMGEHYCGTLALVRLVDTPQSWSWIWETFIL